MMEELKLKRDIELSRAKLNVFDEIEKEQTPSLKDDLANLPSEVKGEGVERFLQSLPVTTSTSEASTSVQLQVAQTPALTTTSTPKSTLSSLHATAPSFSPGAVTQSVFTVRHFDHGHSPPTPGEVPSYENVTSVRINPPVTSFFSGHHQLCQQWLQPLPLTSL